MAIQPWYYPQKDAAFDRLVYHPGRQVHMVEYQHEMVDSKGNIFWKTINECLFDPGTSVKDALSEMHRVYEVNSMKN
tara:strand:- start:377 stop:607 length:231 start_codon:yes stop_codon:yes gene_type:complete